MMRRWSTISDHRDEERVEPQGKTLDLLDVQTLTYDYELRSGRRYNVMNTENVFPPESGCAEPWRQCEELERRSE